MASSIAISSPGRMIMTCLWDKNVPVASDAPPTASSGPVASLTSAPVQDARRDPSPADPAQAKLTCRPASLNVVKTLYSLLTGRQVDSQNGRRPAGGDRPTGGR